MSKSSFAVLISAMKSLFCILIFFMPIAYSTNCESESGQPQQTGTNSDSARTLPRFHDLSRQEAEGLMGYWNFDEGFGSFTADISGNENHGTIDGAQWTSSGRIKWALNFDGVDDSVVVPSSDRFSYFYGDGITLSAWIKPTHFTADHVEVIVSKGKDDNPRHFFFYVEGSTPDAGNLSFFYWDAENRRHDYSAKGDLVQRGKWYHVAFSFIYGEGSSAALYLNGEPIAGSWEDGDGNASPQINDFDVHIGAENHAGRDERFNGIIDEVRIYNRALRSSEIHDLRTQDISRVPVVLDKGPHLLIDDFLIESSQSVTRLVNRPLRYRKDPVIGGYFEDRTFLNGQHSARIFHDGSQFQMWYTALGPPGSDPALLHYTTSKDGENWDAPLDDSYFSESVGTGIIQKDGGYVAINTGEKDPTGNRWYGNLYSSEDGFRWKAFIDNPVTTQPYGEVWMPYRDAIRDRYGLLHRWNKPYRWIDLEGKSYFLEMTRLYGQTTSNELFTWPPSDAVFYPDSLDIGETQFYVVSNVIQRGELLLTMLCIMRDDLKAPDTPDQVDCPWYDRTYRVFGIGYTVLAWTRDGITWHRDRHTDEFFEPDPNPEAWDHSHAWITDITEVDDEVYLYYGGYKYGHKVYCDRSIGLVKMKRDRYVAWEAGEAGGWLRTRLLDLRGDKIILNVNAEAGEIKVQVLDIDGNPVPGFSLQDCQPITTDSLDAEVRFDKITRFPNEGKKPALRPKNSEFRSNAALEEIKDKPVYLEFFLRNARLFAVQIQ